MSTSDAQPPQTEDFDFAGHSSWRPMMRIAGTVQRDTNLWLGTVFLLGCAFSISFALLMVVKWDHFAILSTTHGRLLHYFEPTSYDSWMPMLKAHRQLDDDPLASPYDVFFEGQGKFQYPPSMLLLSKIVPNHVAERAIAEWEGSLLQRWNDWSCRLAVIVTIAISAAILQLTVIKFTRDPLTRAGTILSLLLVALLCIAYYPLIVGYRLGQMQLWLNALIAAAVLCFVGDRKLLAGMCIGVCCLVKPQYGLLLLWSLVRGERQFSAGILVPVVPVLLIAASMFGVASFVDYVSVLRVLSERGEVFWYNQSISGLLHRFVDPESAYYFDEIGSPLPPYRRWIHMASTAMGVGLLALAFIANAAPSVCDRRRVIDLAAMIIAATIASPVAWNHHYGAFLPLFMAAVPMFLARHSLRDRVFAIALAIAYLAIALEVVWPGLMFASPWRGVLSSHMYFGGILLLATFILWRRLGSDCTGFANREMRDGCA